MAKEVIIYTSDTCPHCYTAKDYFNERGIEFIEKNIQRDPAARQELVAKGIMAVPVVVIDGETMVGFDRDRVDDLLG